MNTASFRILFLIFSLPLTLNATLPTAFSDASIASGVVATEKGQSEGDRLLQEAESLFNEGQFGRALERFQQALTTYKRTNDQDGQGNVLLKLGATHEILGQYEESLEWYELASSLFSNRQDLKGEGAARSGMGLAYLRLGRYGQALSAYQEALEIRRRAQDKSGEAISLSGIGVVYMRLGEYERALEYHQEALDLRRTLSGQRGEATSFHNIGMVYEALGDYSRALQNYQQSFELYKKFNDLTGQERSLSSIAEILIQQNQTSEAIELLQNALNISQNIQDPLGEGIILGKIGRAYEAAGDYESALQNHRRALQIDEQINSPLVKSISLQEIASLLEKQNQLELAILFYKDFVNVVESVRQDIAALPEEVQSSFTATIEDTYRHLANLLLQEDRVLESQQVLDLLKVQELESYLRGVRGSTTASGIDFWQAEQEILERFNTLQKSAIELSQELTQLRTIPEAQRTSAQRSQIDKLVSFEENLNRQFNDFIQSDEIIEFVQQLNVKSQGQTLNLEEVSRLQDDLAQVNAALLYPLILDNRLELIITTPNTPPLRRTVFIGRTELNQAILDFRQALEDPTKDVKPSAQWLYQRLIEPLEPDLVDANIQTIIYAPDGQLRYIPLSALFDGERWLVERYAINNITARSLTDLHIKPNETPRVLAGAFTNPNLNYSVTLGRRNVNFQGLPFAGVEVRSLVDALPNIISFIDQDFSLSAVRSRLNEYDIIHFATHAAFIPGNPEDSFILFGNGDRPTLADVRDWSLNNVDLVVLSACETGLGGFGNGEEILGLGYQFQRAGARAAIASLWSVSDGGTQTLMDAFYSGLTQGMSKTKALQQAQVALITGDFSTVGGQRGGIEVISALTNQPLSPGGGLAHPYYWAPFILIGNGL